MKQSQVTYWCQEMIRFQVKKGGIYVDATMGNGNDTLLFAKMAEQRGKVFAFDIQKAALEKTEKLLSLHGASDRVRLILDSHENMDRYLEKNSADAICFNFGYLPGGDHRIATDADTSVRAVSKALKILKPGGMLSLCIYSGGDTGFEEKEKILAYLKELPPKEYTVIQNTYFNRGSHPPMPVFVFKEGGPDGDTKQCNFVTKEQILF